MKKIAVITGASSGMGRRFAETADRAGTFDEIWAIARRRERLEELGKTAPFPVRPIPMDLSLASSWEDYAALLREEEAEVGLLINAAGFGAFRSVMDTPLERSLNMVDVNCRSLMALCQLTVPHMPRGGHIINMASVAAYQPTPYIAVYAASKALVLSYSRALHRELRDRGISVTAVCPFWTRTEFFDRAVDETNVPVVKKYIAMYESEDVVDRAWRDALRGRDMSKYGFIARAQGLLTKLLPHRLVMDVWQRQQDLI